MKRTCIALAVVATMVLVCGCCNPPPPKTIGKQRRIRYEPDKSSVKRMYFRRVQRNRIVEDNPFPHSRKPGDERLVHTMATDDYVECLAIELEDGLFSGNFFKG